MFDLVQRSDGAVQRGLRARTQSQLHLSLCVRVIQASDQVQRQNLFSPVPARQIKKKPEPPLSLSVSKELMSDVFILFLFLMRDNLLEGHSRFMRLYSLFILDYLLQTLPLDIKVFMLSRFN